MNRVQYLDHRRYLTDRPYRRLTRAMIRRLAAEGCDGGLTVVHSPFRTCCRLQPWPTTLRQLALELQADGLTAADMAVAP